jgi:hypothetical protein
LRNEHPGGSGYGFVIAADPSSMHYCVLYVHQTVLCNDRVWILQQG